MSWYYLLLEPVLLRMPILFSPVTSFLRIVIQGCFCYVFIVYVPVFRFLFLLTFLCVKILTKNFKVCSAMCIPCYKMCGNTAICSSNIGCGTNKNLKVLFPSLGELVLLSTSLFFGLKNKVQEIFVSYFYFYGKISKLNMKICALSLYYLSFWISSFYISVGKLMWYESTQSLKEWS